MNDESKIVIDEEGRRTVVQTEEEFQKLADEKAVPEDEGEDEGRPIETLQPEKVLYKGFVPPGVPVEEPPPFSNREIKYHRVVDNRPDKLIITANAPEDPGGAPDGYLITHIETSRRIGIYFQTLLVKEGVTNEALLAIIKDRLVCWQAGPFKDDFNEIALESINTVLDALKTRTLNRIKRGVEGMEIP